MVEINLGEDQTMTLMHHDDPGGSTPAGRLHLDTEALQRAARQLITASMECDEGGAAAPSAGSGTAAPLVALALGAHLEAASLIVSDARVLAAATSAACSEQQIADADAALDFFTMMHAS